MFNKKWPPTASTPANRNQERAPAPPPPPPAPPVQPVAETRAPCIEADDGRFVEIVDKECVTQQIKDLRLEALQSVRGLGTFDRLSAIEPPADAKAEKEDDGGRQHHR